MKHLLIIFAFSCMIVLALTSCTNFSVDEGKTDLEKNVLQSLLLEKGTTPITADEAVNVAKIFELKHRPSTKASPLKEIAGVQTIFNKEGHPVMYAVCYQKNQGFIIVSASRKYQPILAEEERYSFSDHRRASGVDLWIQEQTALINYAETLPETDASIKQYVNDWKDYERHPITNITTKSGDLLSLRAASIAAWEAQGYTCYDMSDGCPNSLPESVYEDWLDLAEQVANPEYNYLTNSIILYKREDAVTQTGPLMQTTWGQDQPYNEYTPIVGGLNARAGCSVVAIAQIMKYYGWPNSYSWSSMANHYGLLDSAPQVAGLLAEIGSYANTNYKANGSSTKIDSVRIVITGSQFPYHYYATVQNPHNLNTTMSEILSNRPVFMQGQDNTPTPPVAHAWVCDGYKTQSIHRNFILKVLSTDEPLSYITAGNPYNSYENSSYLHMNWGEDGDANGWFYQDNVHYSGPFQGITVEFNFSAYRKDIIGITPNYNY